MSQCGSEKQRGDWQQRATFSRSIRSHESGSTRTPHAGTLGDGLIIYSARQPA